MKFKDKAWLEMTFEEKKESMETCNSILSEGVIINPFYSAAWRWVLINMKDYINQCTIHEVFKKLEKL